MKFKNCCVLHWTKHSVGSAPNEVKCANHVGKLPRYAAWTAPTARSAQKPCRNRGWELEVLGLPVMPVRPVLFTGAICPITGTKWFGASARRRCEEVREGEEAIPDPPARALPRHLGHRRAVLAAAPGLQHRALTFSRLADADPLVTGQVAQRGYLLEPGFGQQPAHSGALVIAVFNQ